MRKILAIVFFCFITNITYSQTKSLKNTKVYGIVLDSKDYYTLEGVKVIFNNKVISTTDSNGYFSTEIRFNSRNNEALKLSFSKNGYKNLNSMERWGTDMLEQGVNYLVGLRSGNTAGFTDVSPGDYSYEQTLDKLEDIKTKKFFNAKLDEKRLNNEDSVFEIDGNFYILSDKSWIEVNSLEESVRINNKKSIPIRNLNAEIKRSQIDSLTPDEFQDGLYHVYTK